jgi:hypothetical protein
MDTLFLVIGVAFVLAVLAIVGYSIFEISPYAHHKDHYRDELTGERRFDSPHLD